MGGVSSAAMVPSRLSSDSGSQEEEQPCFASSQNDQQSAELVCTSLSAGRPGSSQERWLRGTLWSSKRRPRGKICKSRAGGEGDNLQDCSSAVQAQLI